MKTLQVACGIEAHLLGKRTTARSAELLYAVNHNLGDRFVVDHARGENPIYGGGDVIKDPRTLDELHSYSQAALTDNNHSLFSMTGLKGRAAKLDLVFLTTAPIPIG